MDILFLLLPLALLLGVVGLIMMIWALRNDQFDDMEGASRRILYDDDQEMVPTPPPRNEATSNDPADTPR
ncbi:MAG: cbb3-type cytochrome oxidase assembly protein CcoS [Magnetococcales bacterium]|nr:cbb3-type cytochrome oxidase assembly protein CcoS [Magnetococcales bacterium]